MKNLIKQVLEERLSELGLLKISKDEAISIIHKVHIDNFIQKIRDIFCLLDSKKVLWRRKADILQNFPDFPTLMEHFKNVNNFCEYVYSNTRRDKVTISSEQAYEVVMAAVSFMEKIKKIDSLLSSTESQPWIKN
jgi:hypothetical protein